MKRLLLLILLLISPLRAFAHDVNVDVVRVVVTRKGAFVSVGLHKPDKKMPYTNADIHTRLGLLQGGKPVQFGKPTRTTDDTTEMLYWQAPIKTGKGDYSLSRAFRAEQHIQTALMVFQDGKLKSETVYDSAKPQEQTNANSAVKPIASPSLWSWSLLVSYGKLGIEHLATGLDHILFVIGLVLAGGRLRQIVKIVTCFTLAHSITLGVAGLGLFSLNPRIVEPLIALSIVGIALETILRKPDSRDIRPYLAFGFGLIHGFGFAGGIIEKGFPQEAVAPALLGFNVGLEIAQIVVASITLLALANLTRLQPLKAPQFRIYFAYGLSLVALFWFVQRIVF